MTTNMTSNKLKPSHQEGTAREGKALLPLRAKSPVVLLEL